MLKTEYNLTKEEIVKKYSALSQQRGLDEEFNHRVISLAGDMSGKKVQNAGCGYGGLFMEIDRCYPDKEVCFCHMM